MQPKSRLLTVLFKKKNISIIYIVLTRWNYVAHIYIPGGGGGGGGEAEREEWLVMEMEWGISSVEMAREEWLEMEMEWGGSFAGDEVKKWQ